VRLGRSCRWHPSSCAQDIREHTSRLVSQGSDVANFLGFATMRQNGRDAG